MATLKQRLNYKRADGEYDIVHLETSADLVLLPDGVTTVLDTILSMYAKLTELQNTAIMSSIISKEV